MPRWEYIQDPSGDSGSPSDAAQTLQLHGFTLSPRNFHFSFGTQGEPNLHQITPGWSKSRGGGPQPTWNVLELDPGEAASFHLSCV